jgi:hypothetical protein
MMKFLTMMALSAAAVAPAAAEMRAATDLGEAEVSDGDAAPTRPRLLVEVGRPATIEIANERFALRVTATPDEAANVVIASLVTSWAPSGLVHQDRHAEVRADGTPLRLSFMRTDAATGETRPLEVRLQVQPAD